MTIISWMHWTIVVVTLIDHQIDGTQASLAETKKDAVKIAMDNFRASDVSPAQISDAEDLTKSFLSNNCHHSMNLYVSENKLIMIVAIYP